MSLRRIKSPAPRIVSEREQARLDQERIDRITFVLTLVVTTGAIVSLVIWAVFLWGR